MVKFPVNNAKYWCCLPTTEEEAYGNGLPKRPWEGVLIIHKSLNNPGSVWMSLCQFDDKGIADGDSNASCVIDKKDLFNTKEEALNHYKMQLTEIISVLNKELGLLSTES